MPVSRCTAESKAPAHYYGTYLATKRLAKESGLYLVRIIDALRIPDAPGPTITPDDFFATYRARNKDALDVALVLEEDRIRAWDKRARTNSDETLEALRKGRYFAGDGFVYPLSIENKVLAIPKHYAEKLQLKRDLIIAATYDDSDPGETFCIYRPSQVEKILKCHAKYEMVRQR